MKKFAFAAAVAAMIVATSPVLAADAVEMRVSHQLPPKHHIAKLVEQWAADIEQLSGNSIDVQVFGANQAFKASENYPAVAKGNIEAALAVNFQWGKTIPVMNVTLMPYSFTDIELMKKFPGSPVATFLEKKLMAKGVKNIGWFFVTNSSIFTSNGKALVKPANFVGVKLRGLNPLVDSGLRALGAAPSAMSGSQVYQALQTGVIDAGLTDISAAVSRKYYEVQEYGAVSPFFSVFFHMYVNPKWWDGLSDAQRDAIHKASAKAEADAIRITEETAAAAPGQLSEKGMKVHILNDAEVQAMKDITLPAFKEEFLKAGGDDAKEILDLIAKL